jgi:hypothetical protein
LWGGMMMKEEVKNEGGEETYLDVGEKISAI